MLKYVLCRVSSAGLGFLFYSCSSSGLPFWAISLSDDAVIFSSSHDALVALRSLQSESPRFVAGARLMRWEVL